MQVSSHSTPTLQLGPAEWRLELEGIGWFRALGGKGVEWARWDDSVSDRDLRTFLVTSGLGAVALGIDWQELPAVRRGLKRYALLPQELPQGVACAQKPVTLRCIYQLVREREETPNPALTASKSFSQQAALLALRNQMFHARMVRGMGMEQELFLQAAQLARTVPVHRLRVADGIKAMAAAVTAADLLDPASLMEANDG